MIKTRMLIKKIWKKIYILLPLMILILFIQGFLREYIQLKNLEYEVTATPEAHAHQYNEIMYEVYDGFSKEAVISNSLSCGIAQCLFYSALIMWILCVATCLVSEKKKTRNAGVLLLIVSITVLSGYIWFVNNFKLTF